MLVSLVVGLISLRVGGRYSALGAGFAFAWFLVAFALHAYAWILRDHNEWLQSRRDPAE